MKISTLANKLQPFLPLLRCPLCHQALSLSPTSLFCQSGHCFDLSAKGYVNLAPSHSQAADKYDASLFESRRAVFEDGFYAPVLACIKTVLGECFGSQPFSLLDVGCGEGYYARALAPFFPAAQLLGADLNRSAIQAAARGDNAIGWFVADLKHLPIQDGSLHAILDVLTPADYAEFKRVLAPGGLLMKLVPGKDYLCEVRSAVAEHLQRDQYNNERVLSHLECYADILEHIDIRHTLSVTQAQAHHFLQMTPMTFSVPQEVLDGLSLPSITIHMELLLCKLK
ncbi:MAG: methyltransferase domain-containing protein [Clostridia bacterium]